MALALSSESLLFVGAMAVKAADGALHFAPRYCNIEKSRYMVGHEHRRK